MLIERLTHGRQARFFNDLAFRLQVKRICISSNEINGPLTRSNEYRHGDIQRNHNYGITGNAGDA